MTKILIVGATSGIAQALGRRYAQQHASLFLVARDAGRVAEVATDIRARGADSAEVFVMDALNIDRWGPMLTAAWQFLGQVDIAVVAHGTLPDEARSRGDAGYLAQQFRVNAESVLICLAGVAERMRIQGHGVIAVVGSVAGDRGRASNYSYGAAKAAVHAYASGLRAYLLPSGVHVLTVKPGFVATPMTAGLKLPARLTAQPDDVAARIERSIASRRDVVYTPGFWWLIMTIIRLLPEALFKRLKF